MDALYRNVCLDTGDIHVFILIWMTKTPQKKYYVSFVTFVTL